MNAKMTMNEKMTMSRIATATGGLAVGVAAALTLLIASPLRAQDGVSSLSAVAAEGQDADSVDYRAPGVSYQQFGKAAKALAEGGNAANTLCTRWVFTRAFAWAAYEYSYNRPNYDRWLAQLNDPHLQDFMEAAVQEYVAAGKPPIANPMSAADDAVASYRAYRSVASL